MPRPANSIPSGVSISTSQKHPNLKVNSTPTDVIIISADYAVWNETQSKFIPYSDLKQS
jgi:hypothetical protein